MNYLNETAAAARLSPQAAGVVQVLLEANKLTSTEFLVNNV